MGMRRGDAANSRGASHRLTAALGIGAGSAETRGREWVGHLLEACRTHRVEHQVGFGFSLGFGFGFVFGF